VPGRAGCRPGNDRPPRKIVQAWHRTQEGRPSGLPGRNPASSVPPGLAQGGDQGDGELQEIMHGRRRGALIKADVFFGGPTKIRPSGLGTR